MLACVVLATFRWWLGLGLLVVWLLVRRPLGARIRCQATRARSAGGAAAPQLVPARPRVEAARGQGDARLRPRRLDRRPPPRGVAGGHAAGVARAPAAQRPGVDRAARLVLAAYARRRRQLGFAADHDEISLRTLATMLPMLPTSMAAGSITLADISLEQLLASLPDLDALDRASRPRTARARIAGARPRPGCRASRVRFERVDVRLPGREEPVLPRARRSSCRSATRSGSSASTAPARRRSSRCSRGCASRPAGAITVDGVPLDRLDAREWQRQVAVVYQDFARLPLTRGRERRACSATAPPDPALLAAAAERAGAAEMIAALPRGWDTVLSPHYDRRRRPVAAASGSGSRWRARCTRSQTGARVLVLDEPTAQLDIRGEAAFYDRFLELTAGVTSIVISHRFAQRPARRIGSRCSTAAGSPSSAPTTSCSPPAARTPRCSALQAERFAAEPIPTARAAA